MMTVDQYLAKIAGIIDRHGWAVQFVGGSSTTEPGFHYTVGLTHLDHPELVVCGLPYETGCHILNDQANFVRSGFTLLDNQIREDVFGNGVKALTIDVHPAQVQKRLGIALQLFMEVKAVQLLWPDKNGKWPWQPEWDAGGIYPILGTVTEASKEALK